MIYKPIKIDCSAGTLTVFNLTIEQLQEIMAKIQKELASRWNLTYEIMEFTKEIPVPAEKSEGTGRKKELLTEEEMKCEINYN